MVLTIFIIKEAINNGYRVTEDGFFYKYNTDLDLNIESYYPTITIETIYSNTGTYNLSARKLAAYCFYGDKTFKKGTSIKHLDGNPYNLSKANLFLDNSIPVKVEEDRTKRSKAASIARAAQGIIPANAKLDQETRDAIIKLRELKYSYSAIGLKFNVHKSTIHNLLTRRTYCE